MKRGGRNLCTSVTIFNANYFPRTVVYDANLTDIQLLFYFPVLMKGNLKIERKSELLLRMVENYFLKIYI